MTDDDVRFLATIIYSAGRLDERGVPTPEAPPALEQVLRFVRERWAEAERAATTSNNDSNHEERAIWQLDQAGYRTRRTGASYVVADSNGYELAVADLELLQEYARTVYDRLWTKRKLTPSA